MNKYLLLIFCFSCSIIFSVRLIAQTPGTWISSKVCDHCTEPFNVVFADNLHGFLISEGTQGYKKSNMYKTEDGGLTWQHITSASKNIYFDIKFADIPMFFKLPATIITEVIDGTVLSVDTGHTWVLKPLKGAGTELTALINDPINILVLGGTFFNASNPQILVSHDTGNTFEKIGQTSSSIKTTQSACIIDSTNAWFGAMDTPKDSIESLYHTVDGGETWKQVFPVDTNLIGKFYFEIHKGSDKNTIYLVNNYHLEILGKSYDFLFTTDNGLTWGGKYTDNHHVLNGLLNHVLRNPRGKETWCVLDDHHTIGYSTNYGINWTYDSTTFRNDSIIDMIWQDSVHGYILGYQDSIIHLYTYSQNNSVPFIVNYIHAPFKIIPSITSNIFHLLPLEPLKGIISIHDIFGRKIFEERLNTSGNTPIEFSLSDYASGVYFISYYSGDYMILFKVVKE